MILQKDTASVERIWLKNYPQGTPADIDTNKYRSLVDLFDQTFHQYANHPGFYNLGVTLSYQQIDNYSRDVAAYFQQTLRLQKGDRLAIMLPNVLQYPIVLAGALRAGLIVVNVNPLYTSDELTYQINDSGAVAIVALSNFANTVQKALPNISSLKHIVITELGDLFPFWKACMTQLALKYVYKKIPAWSIPSAISFKKMLAQGKSLTLHPVLIDQQDIAFLQYTGGTTGISKGAILTHRNLLANLEQAYQWFKSLVKPQQEIIVTALPLYHIFSLLANCFFFSMMGSLNILITNPRDIPNMIKEMSKFKFTAITGVNTLFNGLLKDPHFARLDFSSLRLTLGGGMAVQKAVADKWQAVTGAPLLEAYGLTETSPCVTINPPDLKSYNGTIGLPVSSTDIAILDEDGQPLPIGQSGELAVKGPQVMQGYWQNPAETAKVFTPDGWLLTGDIASIDDQGFVRILERKKDMILVSGFNVYPNEIENVLMRMPGIRECAVIGMPDEHSGEIVKAFIVRDNPSLTPEQVVQYCRNYLTAYKVPKQIEFRDDLPKSNVGKILRRSLRECVTN